MRKPSTLPPRPSIHTLRKSAAALIARTFLHLVSLCDVTRLARRRRAKRQPLRQPFRQLLMEPALEPRVLLSTTPLSEHQTIDQPAAEVASLERLDSSGGLPQSRVCSYTPNAQGGDCDLPGNAYLINAGDTVYSDLHRKGSANDVDYYRFRLEQPARVKMSIASNDAINMHVGTLLAPDIVAYLAHGNSFHPITIDVQRGVYYFVLVDTLAYIAPPNEFSTNALPYSLTIEQIPVYSFEMDGFDKQLQTATGRVIRTGSDRDREFPVTIAPVGNVVAPSTAPVTWLVIHGRNSSAVDPGISGLARTIKGQFPGDNVLTLNWSGAAHDNGIGDEGFQGADWIPVVSDWASKMLHKKLDVKIGKLNVVGHSWGSYEAYELAKRLQQASGKKISSIVALDPPLNYVPEGLPFAGAPVNQYESCQGLSACVVDYARHAKRSWAFQTSDIPGDPALGRRADESFVVHLRGTGGIEAHELTPVFFTSLIDPPSAASNIASHFDLAYMRDGIPLDRPWKANRLNEKNLPGFEALIVAEQSDDTWTPTALQYRETGLPDSGVRESTLPWGAETVIHDPAPASLKDAKQVNNVTSELHSVDFERFGWLGAANGNDIYVFDVEQQSDFRLTLDGPPNSAVKARLFKATGDEKKKSPVIEIGEAIEKPNLSPGKYQLKLWAPDNTSLDSEGTDAPYHIRGSLLPTKTFTLISRLTTSGNQIELEWADPDDDEIRFVIERAGEDGEFSQLATIDRGSTVFTDTGVTPNSGYIYQVSAVLEDGTRLYSNEVEQATPAISNSNPVAGNLVVTTVADEGPGSLRNLIAVANATPGRDAITFNIAGAGAHTILVGATTGQPLPEITDPLIIDGTTQSRDYTPGSSFIVLDGSQAGEFANGLRVTAGQTVIRGLTIINFARDGIQLIDKPSNLVERSYIGTDANGTTGVGNGGHGVSVLNTHNTVIGGTIDVAGNTISGNALDGVYVFGANSSLNWVLHNNLGTDFEGNKAIGNGRNGVTLDNTPENEVADNLISGNVQNGIELRGSGWTKDNRIRRNRIGTTADTLSPLGNGNDGISVLDHGGRNEIGGAGEQMRNVISGNRRHGIYVQGPAHDTYIAGNYVGVDGTASVDVGNFGSGIFVVNSANNVIGGENPGEGNLLSGNHGYGVGLYDPGSTGNRVLGNVIGLEAKGTSRLGNDSGGVLIANAVNNVVGGDPVTGNVIAGNAWYGVHIFGVSGGGGNDVSGNFIGTNRNLQLGLGNETGVYINNSPDHRVVNNVIGGNEQDGVVLAGSGYTSGNLVQGNHIGIGPATEVLVPNGGNGVRLERSSGNLLGGSGAGEGNVIAGNARAGIVATAGDQNRIVGNEIFANADLGIDLNDDGPTLNDTEPDGDDTDEGPNRLQNYPLVQEIRFNNGTIEFDYDVPSSESSADFPIRVDFYLADADSEEGAVFLASDTFSVDELVAGGKTFRFENTLGVAGGDRIVTTATDAAGNTSEFSSPTSVSVASGTIRGTAWRDSNSNGIMEENETGLASRTVYIDKNNNGVLDPVDVPVTTNADGSFLFDELPPGTYVLREDVPAGWKRTHLESPRPGAAGHWRFDEAAGGSAADAVDGLEASLLGDTTFASGRTGNAIKLDGEGDLADVASTKPISGARTVTAWVYVGEFNGLGMPIVTAGSSGRGDFFGIAGDAHPQFQHYNLYVDHWGAPGYDSQVAVTPNQWNFVALTFDGDMLRAYVNGVGGREMRLPLYDYDLDTFDLGGNRIAGTTTQDSLNGMLDDVQLYDRALSAPEIQFLFDNPSTSFADSDAGAIAIRLAEGGEATGIRFGSDVDQQELSEIRGVVWNDLNEDGIRTEVVYTSDFENQTGLEAWSTSRLDKTPSQRGFLGQFGNEAVHLTLDDLPSHDQVKLSFDLYVINSWDGNGDGCCGPDVFDLQVTGGPTLLHTTFSVADFAPYNNKQSFPDSHPDGQHPGRTGASENDSLGYVFHYPQGPRPADSVYHFEFAVPHDQRDIEFAFSASGLQLLSDESWGLDNVEVAVSQNEPGLSGVQVFLDENDNGLPDGRERVKESDSDGGYAFDGLVAGRYTVRQVAESGWTLTAPLSGKYTVDVGGGETIKELDFGNAALTPTGQKQVQFRLATTDMETGDTVESLTAGSKFLLNAFVQDMREDPQGVFAAYFDVFYDANLASVDGPITHGAPYVNAVSGDTSAAGLLDEVGGTGGLTPTGDDEVLLFSVPLVATAAGQIEFLVDPADLLPHHDTLVYGGGSSVPDELFAFVSTTLEIIDLRANDDRFEVDEDSQDNRLDVLGNDRLPTNGEFTLAIVREPDQRGRVTVVDNTLVYTPAANFAGQETLAYVISNGKATSTASVTIEVRNFNDPPTAIDIDQVAIEENSPGAIAGQVTVLDPDTSDIHSIEASDGRFEVVSGKLKLRDGVVLDFEAEPSVVIALTATDAGGLSVTEQFTVSVGDVNERPVLAVPLEDQEAVEHVEFRLVVPEDTFVDSDEGDLLSYSAAMADGSSLPAWLFFDAATREFRGTPGAEDVATFDVRVVVLDSADPPLEASDTLRISVAANPFPWQNHENAKDVNDDGFVTPIDALLIINELNDAGARSLPIPPIEGPPPYVDVNGDNFVSPVDALLVINCLNGSCFVQPAAREISILPILLGEGEATKPAELQLGSVRFESNAAPDHWAFPEAVNVPYAKGHLLRQERLDHTFGITEQEDIAWTHLPLEDLLDSISDDIHRTRPDNI